MTDIDQTDGQGKACTKCGEWKLLSEYHRSAVNKTGRNPHCKSCRKATAAAKFILDKDAVLARGRNYYAANKEKEKVRKAKFYEENGNKYETQMAAWRSANPEKVKEYRRQASIKKRSKISGRLSESIKSGIRRGIKDGSKAGRKTFDILGYSVADLKMRLEALFVDGMSWENYGEWHIDHIIPLSLHNYETPADTDFRHAWSLSNLQPLWGIENKKKGNRMTTPFQPSLLL